MRVLANKLRRKIPSHVKTMTATVATLVAPKLTLAIACILYKLVVCGGELGRRVLMLPREHLFLLIWVTTLIRSSLRELLPTPSVSLLCEKILLLLAQLAQVGGPMLNRGGCFFDSIKH